MKTADVTIEPCRDCLARVRDDVRELETRGGSTDVELRSALVRHGKLTLHLATRAAVLRGDR